LLLIILQINAFGQKKFQISCTVLKVMDAIWAIFQFCQNGIHEVEKFFGHKHSFEPLRKCQ
jgi:hypothetical protein